MTGRDFYSECIKRAFQGRLAQAEFGAGLLALIAIPVGLWVWPDQSGAMNWAPLAFFIVILVILVLVGLVAAPYSIYEELRLERDTLKAALDRRAARRDAITALWRIRTLGVEHRNLHITQPQLEEWLATYEQWRTEVLEQAGIVSDGLREWLTTLDRMDHPPAFSNPHVNNVHGNRRHVMSEILLRLQKFLEAEMLNKDITRIEY